MSVPFDGAPRSSDLTEGAERHFSLVFHAAPIGMALVGLDGRFLRVNPAICTILGLAEEDLLTRTFQDLTHPDDLDADLDLVARVLEGEIGSYRLEKRYLRPDGEVVTAQLDVSLVRDRSGTPLHFISQVQDVTEPRGALEALAEAHALQQASLDALEQGVVLSTRDGRVLLVNDAAQRILGDDAQGLSDRFRNGQWETYRPDGTVLPPEERPIRITTVTGDPVREQLVGWRRADGEIILLRLSTASVRDDTGAVSAVVTAFADVTEQRASERARIEAESALRATTAWFSALVERSSDITCVVDAGGRITYVSPAGQALWGDTSSGPGRSFLSMIHSEDRDQLAAQLADLVAHPGETRTAAGRIRTRGRTWRQVEFVATNRLNDPDVAGIVANVRDVTERAEAEAQLRWQAFHDPLTGLPNRALLMERLEQVVKTARASDRTAALLFIDVDRFKVVNDTMGHSAGDQLLIEVAERIVATVRDSDTVARLGGDEFVVLTETPARPEVVTAMATRIGEQLARPVHLIEGAVTVSSSIGIAFDTGSAPEDLLRDADIALYRAKEQGKDRYVVFDESLRVAALRRMTIERELRAALEAGTLMVHYQPVADLTTGALAGTEALLRVPGPGGELVGPAEHVAVADESGLILPVGAHVLDTACAALARWQVSMGDAAPGHMAVNVTGRQLASTGFADHVETILAHHDLDPHHLVLEFTESTVIGADRSTLDTVTTLARMGVGLAVDDFGTGYSSLAYLKRFPISIVKLDRTFVEGVGLDRSDTEIVRAVISLGNALGLTVVAEGIETMTQLTTLRDLGCTKGQGYLIARPDSEEHIPTSASGLRSAVGAGPES